MLISTLSNNQDVVYIYEVGGTLKKIEEAKDIDLLVIIKENSKQEFKKFVFSFYKCIEIDDSIRILSLDKEVNLAIYYRDEIENKIHSYSTLSNPLGEQREWAFGYWIPEVFIDDILNAKKLYSKKKESFDLINFVSRYKKKIETNIVSKILFEKNTKISLLKRSNEKFIQDALKIDLILNAIRLKQLQKKNSRDNFLGLVMKDSSEINNLYKMEIEEFINNLDCIMKE